ncbi:MAG: hypothetical protein V4559_02070 [Pseudomonadota bacterium]
MSEGTEQDLARAMIRLYGSDAESVAAGHAETHADMGDKSKSDRWRRIAAAVADLRVHKAPR